MPYEYAWSRFLRYQRWQLKDLWELPHDYVEQEYLFYRMESKYSLLEQPM